jgi:hypothetical protein
MPGAFLWVAVLTATFRDYRLWALAPEQSVWQVQGQHVSG